MSSCGGGLLRDWGREGQPGDTGGWGGIHHSILPLPPVGGQALGEVGPLQRDGENQKVEVQKLMGSDKGSLTGKAKPAHASKPRGIHSLLPAAGRCSAIPRKLGFITCNGDLGTSPFLPRFYC